MQRILQTDKSQLNMQHSLLRNTLQVTSKKQLPCGKRRGSRRPATGAADAARGRAAAHPAGAEEKKTALRAPHRITFEDLKQSPSDSGKQRTTVSYIGWFQDYHKIV
jgi:hypothetical protein